MNSLTIPATSSIKGVANRVEWSWTKRGGFFVLTCRLDKMETHRWWKYEDNGKPERQQALEAFIELQNQVIRRLQLKYGNKFFVDTPELPSGVDLSA